jgi:DNA-binding MarR family transcriptional regulator
VSTQTKIIEIVSGEDRSGVGLGTLTGLVGYHLRRAFTLFGGDFGRALDGTGMRQVLFGILSVIEANPGISQGMVGRSLGIQRANMVGPVNELIERGWIERAVDPDDRRFFSLMLSPSGREAFHAARMIVRDHEDRLLDQLTVAERQTLLDLLARVVGKDG